MATIAQPDRTTASPACPQLPDGAKAIIPNDTDTFAGPTSVYVGTAGNVVCTPANGAADVTIAMLAGSIVPFRVLAVKLTGTTAGSMVAVY